ncbi:MAG: DUF1622 domain-containing protein, partial [Candidatus Eremiobacteraeota bacterium]|nr:DUF1622 domain-containing protein [Candidatus Eremiobacteraeota bacterium]
VSPSWTAIGQLAAIVAIRIAITVSLTRETRDVAAAAASGSS